MLRGELNIIQIPDIYKPEKEKNMKKYLKKKKMYALLKEYFGEVIPEMKYCTYSYHKGYEQMQVSYFDEYDFNWYHVRISSHFYGENIYATKQCHDEDFGGWYQVSRNRIA